MEDSDNVDFKFAFAQRGFVRKATSPVIYSDGSTHEVIWDTNAYDFLEADVPSTANVSLWRQGQLCSTTAGLYHVMEGIYQIRGFDLANMSIVQIPKTNGIIIIDCLTSVETARAAIELYQEEHRDKFGKDAEIKALFYTHCHVDHFGGAQAIVDIATTAGTPLQIIGPDGFLEHAVSENVYAGPAMARRSIYMYGEALTKSPDGQIGCGLGQALSTGASSLVAPPQVITSDGLLSPAVDGLQIICQLTPGTEAPAEVNFYFPDYRALCMAENATHTLHNIQTLRGAPVRDARLWSRYLDESITLFGDKSDVVFSSHHWPTWNEDESKVVQFLSEQRDYYAYLHNETLRQLNDGKTPIEIAEEIQMPPTLSARTNLRGYYGSVSHNVKAVYDHYMGWFNANPAYLWPLTPVDEATELVKCMGGSQSVLEKAQAYHSDKNLRFAATLLDKLVFATQSNADEKDSDVAQKAKEELAAVYTELGYGAENGTWRNFFLTGAFELQNGAQPSVNAISPASLLALGFDQLFDSIGVRINGPEAFKQPSKYLEKEITIDFMVDDVGNEGSGWHLRLSNAALTGHVVQYTAAPKTRDSNVDLTVWLTHQELVTLVGGASVGQSPTLDQLVTSGNVEAWTDIVSLVALPNPAFNIVTP
ncbi:beta-lactamase domain-containing protein [Penicillium verhagenii]|uniref:beta-lactamase domain-containing protein n=1 Tax=Penicillium verhagenii TaxID=1562060 RepID=UPI0025458AB8|nr:beta-lactamase domain-containing protein [Penicillium verhagenii]KAJ5921104.1 beta-lactamase domain-containing protein [Penicillium verhagenii]